MNGDAPAFCELVRRRQSWLRHLLRRLCRNPALADDLAQQVFLQAWRSLPGLRSVTAFGAWLRRLALHARLASPSAAACPALRPPPGAPTGARRPPPRSPWTRKIWRLPP